MMSGHSRAGTPAVPTDRQRRQLRLALVGNAVGLLLIGLLVYELYAQRVTARQAVRKLACFAVEYAPDTNPTVRDIRQFYGCPPVRPMPSPPKAKPVPRVTVTATVGQGATPVPSSPVATGSRRSAESQTVVTVQPPATPVAHASSASPAVSTSPPVVLGVPCVVIAGLTVC